MQNLPHGRHSVGLEMVTLNLSAVALPLKPFEYRAKLWTIAQVHRSPQTDNTAHGFKGHTHSWFLPRSPGVKLWKEEEAFAAWGVNYKVLPFEQEIAAVSYS